MVSKGHSVPKDWAVAWLISFTIAILTYYILDSIELTPAVVSINNNLWSPNHCLFPSMHQVIWMHFLLFIRLILIILRRALLSNFLLLIILHSELNLLLLWWIWSWNFIILWLLIKGVLVHLTRVIFSSRTVWIAFLLLVVALLHVLLQLYWVVI